MRIFSLPNFITLGNLLCGMAGILALQHSDFQKASLYILVALVLDFFDGFAARLTGTFSEIGKQLDSLADMVSFGVLPSFILFYLSEIEGPLNLLCFLPALFSALRLAKFNIDDRQSYGFYGLPTPANAMTVASFPFLFSPDSFSFLTEYKGFILLAYSVIISVLLIADIPMMALKFKTYLWVDNKIRYIFLITSLITLLLFQIAAIPCILFLYFGFSLIENRNNKKTIF
jgi:CDP-diacylglycerol--serine O-phosphatidyltransferase